MAKKLKKLLNYWFNPENYSIIKSINGIIDTVNELIDGGGGGGGYTLPIATTETLGGVKVDGTTITANGDGVISAIGGGGGGSVETLNWTKVDTTVAIPTPMDIGGGVKLWNIGTKNSFNIKVAHKGLMLESNYFEASNGDLAANNTLAITAGFKNGSDYYSAYVGKITTKTGSPLNRIRVYVVKNPTTGLYQMGLSANEERINNSTVFETPPVGLDTNFVNTVVPLNSALELDDITIAATINTATGAFATQGGVTFSLYVAD